MKQDSQELRCNGCGVKTRVFPSFQIHVDEKRIKTNQINEEIFHKELIRYNDDQSILNAAKSFYQHIVDEHNKNLGWFGKKWVVITYDGIYIRNEDFDKISRYKKYTPTYPYPGKYIVPVHYIVCPLCGRRHYFNKVE